MRCLDLNADGITIWGKAMRMLVKGDLARHVPSECEWGDRDLAIAHLEYEQARRIKTLIMVMGGGYVSSPFTNPEGVE